MNAGRGSARILIVDDDAKVRDVLTGMLESAGYKVDTAANGKLAVRRLQDDQFDVVITDLVMPEQEGIETIKLIRRDYPELKVIAMSGAFGGDYLRIAGYIGAHGTLTKPFRMEVLLQTVQEALSAS